MKDKDSSYNSSRPNSNSGSRGRSSSGSSSKESSRRSQKGRDGYSLASSHKNGDRKKGKSFGADKAKEQEAISLVLQGLEQMNNDKNLQTITLDPQNSYVRRIQHKEIVERGFLSVSVGEGNSRAVQIQRK